MGVLDSILGGFGFQAQSAASQIAGGSVSGGVTGATGGPWTAVAGALLGGVQAYLDYKSTKEANKNAMEIAQMALSAGVPLSGAVPTAQGSYAPVYTGYTPGRGVYTVGDQMGLMSPYQQLMLTSPTTVQQPAGVVVGPEGLPVSGQSGAGALSPAGMFTAGAATVRPIREIHQASPTTGKIHVWRHMGSPVLYSGDLATCKRVKRIARKVASAAGTRRRSPPSKPARRYVRRSRKKCAARRNPKTGRFVKG